MDDRRDEGRFFLKPAYQQRLRGHGVVQGTRHERKLWQLESTEDLFIREISLAELRKEWGENLVPLLSLPNTVAEFRDLSIAMYAELQDKYGIECPVQFRASRNELGEDCLYVEVDKVERANIAEMTAEEKQRAADETYRLRENVLRYYEEKYKSGEPFVFDLTKDSPRELPEDCQYIYGKKKGDTENHMYLIDADPVFATRAAMTLVHPLSDALYSDIDAYAAYKDFSPLLERWKRFEQQIRESTK